MTDQPEASARVHTTDGLDWLATIQPVMADDSAAVGSGRIDFVLGAALAGINLFVSAGVILAWIAQSAGIVIVVFMNQVASPVQQSNATWGRGFEFVVTGSLLGLAVGVTGFAVFARKRWPSYYWPLFGIAIALGSSLVASRL